MQRFFPTAVLFATLVPAALAFGQADGGQLSCGQLLVQRCDSCHYVSRACQNLGKKGRWRWKRTLKAMIQHGAKLTNADAERLLDCLDSQDPNILEACKNPLSFKEVTGAPQDKPAPKRQ